MGNANHMSKEEKMERLRTLWKWLYRLRSVVLAIPVAASALFLAIFNQAKLPAQVGIILQENGEYAHMVGKGVAVLGPLALTAVCLLMMFCSRKVLYPWLISLFSLVLPLVVLLTNSFM